ncbi:precorrin-6y C5,15-methyltransferase (decarboxylating), CbiE subunit [Peptostreptococcus stomatis DSM 17678]|uniref:Precorrin-6y C5,15-methyltransferase (Decarboxylating), CbiE subunit n=1 Tax=Peptostreptococcus stomatis DSM 17678 TaxID=596315 RepID=E0E2E1_9FIRM|nr:cobalt-precorrin-7 (C(5))-methyltransferase [Peptostreptococcus stomatis]EFM64971.1 precorrin-6y C5,15-methyltransferase (decarboxylating), CbiE subunit [Peptostreptococcus stomatis DSM 17678]
MVYVVGVGPGSGLYLTRAGEDIIKRSQLVIGGKRNIDFIRSSIGLLEGQALYILGPDLASMMDQINRNPDKDIVVLASGDPSIYGIADYINRHMPGRKALGDEYDVSPNQGFHMYKSVQDMASKDLVIVPGISSIQYAFSVFQIPMNDLYITSSHGRQPDYDFIFVHDKVAILTDSKIGPRQIAQEVKVRGLDYSFYVGENLSYPDQRLTVGSADDILARDDYDMCLVILIRWRKDDEK